MAESAADFVGRSCNGYVKSFNPNSGWGFVKSDLFIEDIFVSFKTSPALQDDLRQFGRLEGQTCTFMVGPSKTNADAFEATGTTLGVALEPPAARAAQWPPVSAKGGGKKGWMGGAGTGGLGGIHSSRPPPEIPRWPQEDFRGTGKGAWKGGGKAGEWGPAHVGTRCSGIFKSFNIDKGWGFLITDSISSDVFVSFKTAPELAEVASYVGDFAGQPATFVLSESASRAGEFEAHEVYLDIPYKGGGLAKGGWKGDWSGSWKGGESVSWKGGGKGGGKVAGGGASTHLGSRCSGIFKSFNAGKGWGFLITPSVSSDIFVSFNTAPELALVASQLGDLTGRSASFVLGDSSSHAGQLQAQEVYLDDDHYSGGHASPGGEWSRGSFKSFNATKGWGFLVSPDIDGDIFVSYKTAPELRDIAYYYGSLDGHPASFLVQESKSNSGAFEATSISMTSGKGVGYGMSSGKGKTRYSPY